MADVEDITPYWKFTLKLWRTVSMRCRNGHYYFEIDNLGTHKCKQHACVYNHAEKRWPCCGGASTYDPGCVPADHNVQSFNFTEAHDIVIPYPVIADLLTDGDGFDRPTKTISRFNKEEHEKKNVFWEDGYTLKYKV